MKGLQTKRQWDELGVQPCEILLPNNHLNMEKWAVVACDQYTSEPDYWRDVDSLVGNAPSTLRLILPEVYLGTASEKERIDLVKKAMQDYLANDTFKVFPRGGVLVERTCGGKTRTGLLLAIDLEKYDYREGSSSLIRPTEGTILSRIPPRLRIRQDAPIELPHVMVLLDDPCKTFIEPLREHKSHMVYDFDLMKSGGHIRGYFIPEEDLETVRGALSDIYDESCAAYSSPLLFAVGDGNHSLATAKANWELLRQSIPEKERIHHKARYALVELVNVHDEGIVFEPIHRVLFNAPDAIGQLENIFNEQNPDGVTVSVVGDASKFRNVIKDGHVIPFISSEYPCGAICVQTPQSTLHVATLQNALDSYLAQNSSAYIDYIHGDAVVRKLSQEHNIGFFLPPIAKQTLFPYIAQFGALPRKTFSMGQANEKRYYLECREII